jgi:hypothetical protein
MSLVPSTSRSVLTPCLLILCACGCLPASKPPTVEGPIDSTTASQLQARTRSQFGNKYSIDHEVNGREFTANWELGNALKKSSQLQMKPPSDWSQGDLYQALQVVLEAHESKPWYGAIDETVLRLMREAAKADEGRAIGFAEDTPYELAVKVKQHSTEWFLEVQVQILDEDGNALGF